MAEEQKTTVTNSEAKKDVQDVLAELKGEAGSEQPAQDTEEASIVAKAAELGKQSEKAEENVSEPQEKRETRSFQRGGRGGFRNNTKFDPSSLEETDDPVEIRKQVLMTPWRRTVELL